MHLLHSDHVKSPIQSSSIRPFANAEALHFKSDLAICSFADANALESVCDSKNKSMNNTRRAGTA